MNPRLKNNRVNPALGYVLTGGQLMGTFPIRLPVVPARKNRAILCCGGKKKKCRFLARISPISLGLIRAMTVGSIFDVILRGNCVKNMRRSFQKHVEKFCGVSTDPRNFHSKYKGRLKTAVMYRNCTEIATFHITI